MDIYEILKEEHLHVRVLLQQLIEEPRGSGQDIFHKVREALLTHGSLEETLLYPALAAAGPVTQQCMREHKQVEDLLARMNGSDDSDWKTMCQELEADVSGHIRDEEEQLFPKARKLLSPEQTAHLAERWTQMKRTTPTGATPFDNPLAKDGTTPDLERGMTREGALERGL